MTWNFNMDEAPRDGSWVVIWTHGQPEVGRYEPMMWTVYDPVEGTDLFRLREETLLDWRGFNNFSVATCWMPLPDPPTE
jgi:hypothetical protein